MSKCYGCLEDKILKDNYCTSCIKELFLGIVPKPLSFDRKEFYIARKNLASRMSISGVQDKISLSFENDSLVIFSAALTASSFIASSREGSITSA